MDFKMDVFPTFTCKVRRNTWFSAPAFFPPFSSHPCKVGTQQVLSNLFQYKFPSPKLYGSFDHFDEMTPLLALLRGDQVL